jgi:hypothetical protein
MANKCERCGGHDYFRDGNGQSRRADFTDFCAVCGTNLCTKCMSEGCCKNVPAKSGFKSDESADAERVQKAWEKAQAKKK